MKEHTVTSYEILSTMPAPEGTKASFLQEDGSYLYEDVMAFAVAKVTEQTVRDSERLEKHSRPNEVVGLLMPPEEQGEEPFYTHGMIAEEAANFRGYTRKRPR